MSAPKPPFHSISEELLYNIYLKFEEMSSLKESDINTLAKLNAILTDADLMKAEDITSAINSLKGNVPIAGNTLEKLYNIVQGLGNLKSEDIDTLAELNAILSDADLVSLTQLANAISALKGNVPAAADTLEKLYNSVWLPGGNNFGAMKTLGTKDNFELPFITNNTERARIVGTGQFLIGTPNPIVGSESCKLHIVGANALAISGSSFFQDGNVSISLGKVGTSIANAFRISTYVVGGGGVELGLSASNANATIEITDYLFGGTKPEVIRIVPGGYSNTGILIRPNDSYNSGYGYKYLLQGTNPGQQSRYIAAFHGQINFPNDDSYPGTNRANLFAAHATVTNHFVTGFYADVRGTNPDSSVFAFHSTGSRVYFDGAGMSFYYPVARISTDSSPHAGANDLLANGSYIISSAWFIVPMGAERTGMIISPGQTKANGLFISPQQALSSYNYDGYLLWLQYSTTGNNMQGGTTKPMLLMRKHNATLNGFDHSGAFIRMEENIGSSGAFIEALKFDPSTNSLKLKFSVDKNGAVAIAQVSESVPAAAGVVKVYFNGYDLVYLTPEGEERVLEYFYT